MQDKLIKFKSHKDELEHQRMMVYIDLTSKLKTLQNKKITLIREYAKKTNEIDAELSFIKCKKKPLKK